MLNLFSLYECTFFQDEIHWNALHFEWLLMFAFFKALLLDCVCEQQRERLLQHILLLVKLFSWHMAEQKRWKGETFFMHLIKFTMIIPPYPINLIIYKWYFYRAYLYLTPIENSLHFLINWISFKHIHVLILKLWLNYIIWLISYILCIHLGLNTKYNYSITTISNLLW